MMKTKSFPTMKSTFFLMLVLLFNYGAMAQNNEDSAKPVAKIANKTGGEISRNVLIAQTGLFASLSDEDIKCEVTKYTVEVNSNGELKTINVEGYKLSKEVRDLIKAQKKGDTVSFKEIEVKLEDGTIYQSNDLFFTFSY